MLGFALGPPIYGNPQVSGEVSKLRLLLGAPFLPARPNGPLLRAIWSVLDIAASICGI